MERPMRDQVAMREDERQADVSESTGEESSPSWASSSTSNTPSYTSGGLAFDFGQKCAVGPRAEGQESRVNGDTGGRSRLRFCGSLSSDQLDVLDSEVEAMPELAPRVRKPRKGSADSGKARAEAEGRSGSSSKGGKLSRLLRRTHSAGCSKDVPAHALFLREKLPVTKTKSAETTAGGVKDDGPNRRGRKTLAQDMKLRLSFLRRRHTDSSLQATVRPSSEEAQKWGDSFQDLTASKYGLSLFRAFLSREFCEENIEFWLACEDFKKTRAIKLPSKARKIYNDFVAVQSPKEVNLDSTSRTDIMNSLANPSRQCFDQAQKRIQGMMEQDAYIRFLQSEMYQELVAPR